MESGDAIMRLTWYDFYEPFMITVAAGSVEGRPHGVYSCVIPARRERVTRNGDVAAGEVLPRASRWAAEPYGLHRLVGNPGATLLAKHLNAARDV